MKNHSYQLVNPIIMGSFESVYDSKEPLDAAKKVWENLSGHIVNHVPRFIFTMKDISENKLYHFEVKENKKKNNFIIKNINTKIDTDKFDDFTNSVTEYTTALKNKQNGGFKRERYSDLEDDFDKDIYDDSSSSSSYNDDDEIAFPFFKKSPISFFHYIPSVYPRNRLCAGGRLYELNVTSPLFTPVFKHPLCPFTALW
jgi:hypothetical protein